ncbi:MAG TPA: hypothetical protein VJM10_03940 [Candidatus Methylomirabilis sp.]|nr:hypothetical protein [Candidatus Methylomirabilis sp.]
MRRLAELDEAVKFPRSAAEWELFTTMKGAGTVARELTQALRAAADEVRKEIEDSFLPNDEDFVAKVIGDVWKRILKPVMSKYADFGATDTEPNSIARQALADVAKDELGYEGYLPDLLKYT